MEEIKSLLQAYLRDELTETQRQALQVWLDASPDNQALLDELNDPDQLAVSFTKIDDWQQGSGLERIQAYAAAQKTIPTPRRVGFRRAWTAAAAILLLVGGGYWLLHRPIGTPPVVQTTKTRDIPAPATNRATITLGNGQQVFLDNAGNGALAQQGNAQVVKLANGQVAYKVENVTNREILYNTLSNPRGSQVVTLTLSDGTKVWLNAESSIRYPVVFAGSDRTVEITGEGYFEVAQNANRPFQVKKENTVIEVLGTAFNVNAYPDETTLKVTLLQGKVRVKKEGSNVLLQPGQQAVVAVQVERAGAVDTAAVMAWKNGLFAFHNADLPSVMKQLARWYNIEVTYEKPIPQNQFRFNGEMDRDLTLNNVLDLLTNARVHYTIEAGNKLVIRP